MAANDYEIAIGMFNAFIARRLKATKNGPKLMSTDRRVITDDEILALFEFYLRNWCDEHNGKALEVTDGAGKRIFRAILIDKTHD